MTHADINDAISREAVMKIVDEEWICNADYDFRSLVEALEKLPSVTQKTGKWEFHCQHWSKCSICGYADKFADKWNYCPNCGAKMENVEKSLIDIKAESSGC